MCAPILIETALIHLVMQIDVLFGKSAIANPDRNMKMLFTVEYILWRIYAMQELLGHRGLRAREQRESCGLDQRVARRQLCEHLDYAQ
jgi:hypothetical protein